MSDKFTPRGRICGEHFRFIRKIRTLHRGTIIALRSVLSAVGSGRDRYGRVIVKSVSDTDRAVHGACSGIFLDVGPDASPEEVRHAFRTFLREQYPNGVATDSGKEMELLKELYCSYRRLLAASQEHAVVPSSAGEVVVLLPPPPAVRSRIPARRYGKRLSWYGAAALAVALLHLFSPSTAPDRVPAAHPTAGRPTPSPASKPLPPAVRHPLPVMAAPVKITPEAAPAPAPDFPPAMREVARREIAKTPPVATPGKGATRPAHSVVSAKTTSPAPPAGSAAPVQSMAGAKAPTVPVTLPPAPQAPPPEAAPAKATPAPATATTELQHYYLILNKR